MANQIKIVGYSPVVKELFAPWVICRGCERWNLTQIEERWEAIEGCERAFRGTSPRVSTENIGLARIAEGLEGESAVLEPPGKTPKGLR